MSKPIITIRFDCEAMKGGKQGAFIANTPDVGWDAGTTREQAIRELLVSARTLGKPDNIEDYEVIDK